MTYRETCPCGAKLELEDVSITATAAAIARQWMLEHEQSEAHKRWYPPKMYFKSMTMKIEEDDLSPLDAEEGF